MCVMVQSFDFSDLTNQVSQRVYNLFEKIEPTRKLFNLMSP